MSYYRIYIAGPMRGLPEHNYPAFNGLEDWLWCFGLPGRENLRVLNPASNFEGDTSLPYADYMREDIPQLAACNAIVLLPGWEDSEGARLEVEIARHLSLDFWYASPLEDEAWDVEQGSAPPPAVSEEPEPELVEEEAARLVRNGHRQKDYGHPRGDFDTIAALWAPILKAEVTAELVALCMIALKMARLTSNPKHHDSLVDVIGYAICYSRLDEPLSEEAA